MPVSMMSSNERGRKENGAVMKQRQLAVSVVQVRVASKRRPLVLKVSHCCPPNNPGLCWTMGLISPFQDGSEVVDCLRASLSFR